MQRFYRQTFIFVILALAHLSMAATPAAANFITSANVNLTCGNYTMNVTGGNLDVANVSYSVNYTFNVVLNGSSTFTVSDTRSHHPRCQPELQRHRHQGRRFASRVRELESKAIANRFPAMADFLR